MSMRFVQGCVTALLVFPLLAGDASAQIGIDFIADPATPADFTDDLNWLGPEGSFVPSGGFNEFAAVATGGVAFIEQDVIGSQSATFPAPGGLFLAGGSTVEIRNGGSLTFFQPTETVLVDRSALINGRLEIQGDAFLDAENVTFSSSATFAVGFTAGTDTPIRAPGTFGANGANGVLLNGVLELDYSALSDPLGTRTLIDAGGVDGAFTSVNPIGLGANQAVAISQQPVSAESTLLNATVFNQLTLQVNRDTQDITIINPHSVAVELDGFAVLSESGSLVGTNFAGIGNGFQTLPSSNNAVGQVLESPPGSSGFSLQPGTTVIGADLFQRGTPLAFQADPEDLVFQVTAPNEGGIEFFAGAVEYIGTEAPVDNNIALTIDSSGEAALLNFSAFAQEVEAYRITSSDGSLIAAQWDSLADQGVDGGIWSEAGFSDSEQLLELAEGAAGGNDSTTFAFDADGLFNLGAIFNTSGDQDGITFEFLLEGDSEFTEGAVVFGDLPVIADGVVGDFNDDGFVNAADYVVARDLIGSSVDLPNRDPANVGAISVSDINTVTENFDAVGTSAVALSATAVPEPTSVVLLLTSLGLVTTGARRRAIGGAS